MFSFFRSTPKWQSDKSQKRIDALADLNLATENDRQILTKLACEDSDASVRSAAIAYLNDIDTIMQILKRDEDSQVRNTAVTQLVTLLAKPDNAENRLAVIGRISSPDTLIKIIHEAADLDTRLAALASLKDEEQLDHIVRESSVARIRQTAAEGINSPERLESLVRAVQQKDKTVYRILRHKLDTLHQQEKRAAQHRQQQEDLCASMEAHAKAAFNPLYAAKSESLRQQWQALDAHHLDSALTERFETALRLANQQVNDILMAEQRAADEARALQEQQQCIETLESTLRTWHGQDEFDSPSLAALLKTQYLRWDFANKLQAASPEKAARYQKVNEQLVTLEKLLLQWQADRNQFESATSLEESTESANQTEENQQRLLSTQAQWQTHDLALPHSLQKLLGVTPVRKETHSKLAVSQESRQKLNTLLDDVASQIKNGNSKQASRLLRKARDFAKADNLNSARLGELAEKVRELQSWAGFAVLPKKEALVAQMREIISREMDPDDKADAIHALQEEWKSLGVADASAEQPLWEQFKAAADEAFEPCRQYFATQRDIRQKNLENRRALCEQLQGYLDNLPESPDWKAHEALIRTARQTWLQHHPSDRQETKALKDRFDALLKALEAPLQANRQRNEAAKRELIAQALALGNDSDNRAACDKAKALQQSWKAIGQAHHKVDQALWQEFRQACDAVFAKRDAEFQARKAEREASVVQAETLINNLLALTGSDSNTLQNTLNTLSDNFQALQLPKEKFAELRDKFHAARRKVESIIKEHRQAALREKQDAILARWQALASDNASSDKASTLLLDLEILLDMDSPAAQQAERQARQIQQLQERGLRRASKEEAGKLIQELLQTAVHTKDLTATTERLRPLLAKAEQ